MVGVIGSGRVSSSLNGDTPPLTTIGLGPSGLLSGGGGHTLVAHLTYNGQGGYDTEDEDKEERRGERAPGGVATELLTRRKKSNRKLRRSAR